MTFLGGGSQHILTPYIFSGGQDPPTPRIYALTQAVDDQCGKDSIFEIRYVMFTLSKLVYISTIKIVLTCDLKIFFAASVGDFTERLFY